MFCQNLKNFYILEKYVIKCFKNLFYNIFILTKYIKILNNFSNKRKSDFSFTFLLTRQLGIAKLCKSKQS